MRQRRNSSKSHNDDEDRDDDNNIGIEVPFYDDAAVDHKANYDKVNGVVVDDSYDNDDDDDATTTSTRGLLSLVEGEEDEETLLEKRDNTATSHSCCWQWMKPMLYCTVFYLVVWILCIICSKSARTAVSIIQIVSSTILYISIGNMLEVIRCSVVSLLFDNTTAVPRRQSNNSNSQNGSNQRRNTTSRCHHRFCNCLYVIILSWCIKYKPSYYVGSYHYMKTSNDTETFKCMFYDLNENTIDDYKNDPYVRNVFQAIGLGNGYLNDLADALVIHFNRYGKNETEQLSFIKTLNLIGNVFNDKGLEILINKALSHPHSYIESLLIGRNTEIGDITAYNLAHLKKKSSSSSLTYLEMGSTSITSKGIQALYESTAEEEEEEEEEREEDGMKKKKTKKITPFTFLGFEYLDRRKWFFFQEKSVSKSLKSLSKSTYLQELELTGNRLNDEDMKVLASSALNNNITALTLS